ncbi:MAG: hypothetical protein B7X00_01455, partial [Legionella sp. 21-45-4]
MNNQDIDILVVGGGIVGAAMLCALAPLGKRVLLVDEKPARAEVGVDFDARTLTLSRSSVAILKQLGVWSLLEPLITPIRMIHVSEQGALGRACLYPERQEALLGAVIEISHLKKALFATLNPSAYLPEAKLTAFNADLKEACIETPIGIRRVTADVVIAADGTDSSLRAWCHLSAQEKRYSEEALVTNVGLMRPHGEIAYERFTPEGPMALLPMPNLRAGVVWVQSLKRIQQLKQLTDADFLATLQREFGYRLGRFTQVGSRLVYPLRQVVMPECV